MVSCQSKTQNKETNTSANQLKMKEQFPNQKTAFEKINDKVTLYKPSGNKVVTIDLKSSEYNFSSPDEVYAKYLIKVNDFMYFLPKKITSNYEFSGSDNSTSAGDFNKVITVNDLGLITSIKNEFPQNNQVGKNNAEFTYNKFAQLLKISDNGKTVVENQYDDNGNLLEIKTSEKHSKYQYDTSGKVIQSEIDKKGVKNTFNYRYNTRGWIEKKYTEDQNMVKEFTYNSKGELTETIEYSGTIDKSDSNKLVNHFTKKEYTYNNNQIAEETEYEYNIVNASVLVDKKWQPITIDEQRKLAWKKLRDQSELPVSGIENIYNYQSGQINLIKNKYSFSNRVKNGKTEQNKELLSSDSIKFTLDSSGKAIKKEKSDQNKKIEIHEFSY